MGIAIKVAIVDAKRRLRAGCYTVSKPSEAYLIRHIKTIDGFNEGGKP